MFDEAIDVGKPGAGVPVCEVVAQWNEHVVRRVALRLHAD